MAFQFGGAVAAVALALPWRSQPLQLNFHLSLQTGAGSSRGRRSGRTLSTELPYANNSCFKALKLPNVVQLKGLLLEYFSLSYLC